MPPRASIIAPIADTFGPKLTRSSRGRRTATGVRDHRHSLPVVVAATLATPLDTFAAIARISSFPVTGARHTVLLDSPCSYDRRAPASPLPHPRHAAMRHARVRA